MIAVAFFLWARDYEYLNSLEKLFGFIVIGKVESGEPVIRLKEMEERLGLFSLLV